MTVFELSNLLVLPFWILMVLVPTWGMTRRIMASPWVVAPPALLYLVTLVPVATMVLPEVINPVQARIMSLLGTPTGTTLAWAHLVAFDLFVGRWIYLDSRSRSYSAWGVPDSRADAADRPGRPADVPWRAERDRRRECRERSWVTPVRGTPRSSSLRACRRRHEAVQPRRASRTAGERWHSRDEDSYGGSDRPPPAP